MPSTLKGAGFLAEYQDLLTTSATAGGMQLGGRATTGDGREFRFVLAGASALIVGNLIQSPAQQSGNTQLTPAAAAVGATTVTVTLGTIVTANQYAGGLLVVSTDGGSGGLAGSWYKIKSHPAAAGSATCVMTLQDPLLNLITTSAKIDLSLDPFNGVLQYPTTGTGAPVGSAVFAVTAAQYGWVQAYGAAALLNDAGGGITVGNSVVPSTSVGGAVKSVTGTLPRIGTALTTVTVSSVGTFFINLPA